MKTYFFFFFSFLVLNQQKENIYFLVYRLKQYLNLFAYGLCSPHLTDYFLTLLYVLLFCSYGSTKCGLRQLHSSLLKESKKSKVGVHTASPGMVLTDLLLR